MDPVNIKHLEAMGLLPPEYKAPALPVPVRRPVGRQVLKRVVSLRGCDLNWSLDWWQYAAMKQENMGAAERAQFKRGRRQHKLMQLWQNSLARRYKKRVRQWDPTAPDPIKKMEAHLKWVPRFLAKEAISPEDRALRHGKIANMAEEVAIWPIEQAEKHSRLLTKWPWGYKDLYQRRRHERYARLARNAATN
ncbi:hypothetical protein SNK03_003007 [Fusarium graminearum]